MVYLSVRILRVPTSADGRQETIPGSAACAPLPGVAVIEFCGDRERLIETLMSIALKFDVEALRIRLFKMSGADLGRFGKAPR